MLYLNMLKKEKDISHKAPCLNLNSTNHLCIEDILI